MLDAIVLLLGLGCVFLKLLRSLHNAVLCRYRAIYTANLDSYKISFICIVGFFLGIDPR